MNIGGWWRRQVVEVEASRETNGNKLHTQDIGAVDTGERMTTLEPLGGTSGN